MNIALNGLFVLWCAGLLGAGLCGVGAWLSFRGEANGGAGIGRGIAVICGALLALSIGLRVLL